MSLCFCDNHPICGPSTHGRVKTICSLGFVHVQATRFFVSDILFLVLKCENAESKAAAYMHYGRLKNLGIIFPGCGSFGLLNFSFLR
jgi:hypothetical protein